MKNLKKAFTLIELLVVISIIGILSTIGVISFNSARKKAREKKIIHDLNLIKKAVIVRRIEEDKVFGKVTGSFCFACNCWWGKDGGDKKMQSDSCKKTAEKVYKNLGFASPLKDPWGRYYIWDENEAEFGYKDCRDEWIWCVSTGDKVKIPPYRTVCGGGG